MDLRDMEIDQRLEALDIQLCMWEGETPPPAEAFTADVANMRQLVAELRALVNPDYRNAIRSLAVAEARRTTGREPGLA